MRGMRRRCVLWLVTVIQNILMFAFLQLLKYPRSFISFSNEVGRKAGSSFTVFFSDFSFIKKMAHE